MIIPNASQIREWDQFTILHEPISSIDLMERAATACVEWIGSQTWNNQSFLIFCGKGNNGGDGLAIARLLLQREYKISVFILEHGKPGSPDFQTNLQRLHEHPFNDIFYIQDETHLPLISHHDILIDAVFGTGLREPLHGLAASLVQHINHSGAEVISIDLPSGLFADQSTSGNAVVQADHTLSFEVYKAGLLLHENARFIGDVHILPIGLHPAYLDQCKADLHLIESGFIRSVFIRRNAFAHKGNFGHALLLAGSYGKMGAALLAAKAMAKSGVGLITCYIPKCGYEILQTAIPEAMVITDEEEKWIAAFPDNIESYQCIGLGPGLGTTEATRKSVSYIVKRYKRPLVLDADALNCIALDKELLTQLSSFSILTPHPKEFDRLFGPTVNEWERIQLARQKAKELQVIIVLKGHHTLIAMPGGTAWFNSTGNAGMAKGGSGDVLTGLLTSLLAQGYEPVAAALMGVYLHGLAGDLAAEVLSQEAMTASDLILFFGQAFKTIS